MGSNVTIWKQNGIKCDDMEANEEYIFTFNYKFCANLGDVLRFLTPIKVLVCVCVCVCARALCVR